MGLNKNKYRQGLCVVLKGLSFAWRGYIIIRFGSVLHLTMMGVFV